MREEVALKINLPESRVQVYEARETLVFYRPSSYPSKYALKHTI